MGDINTYEATIKPRGNPVVRKRRIRIIASYVGFTAMYFTVSGLVLSGALFYPLIFALPLILAAIALISWKYMFIEYEYLLENGSITFSEIYARRSRKVKLEVNIKDFIEIAPYGADGQARVESFGVCRDYIFMSSLSSPRLCYGIFKGEEDSVNVVYFDTDSELALRLVRYNPVAAKELRVKEAKENEKPTENSNQGT